MQDAHFYPHAKADATHALIWIHGLGAQGDDFLPLLPHLSLNSVRVILPNAPVLPVTVNGGMQMPAWYDITRLDINADVDEAGILTSVARITQMVDALLNEGFTTERIALAGFSQGGVIAYHSAFACLKRGMLLAGVLALSTYLPKAGDYPVEAGRVATPIVIHHGTQDPIVPYTLAKSALADLTALGFDVHLTAYEMGHEVIGKQIIDINAALQGFFNEKNQ